MRAARNNAVCTSIFAFYRESWVTTGRYRVNALMGLRENTRPRFFCTIGDKFHSNGDADMFHCCVVCPIIRIVFLPPLG